MASKPVRRRPPRVTEALEEKLREFLDRPGCPDCISHSYDCDGIGGGYDVVFLWKGWYVAFVMEEGPVIFSTFEKAVLKSGVALIGSGAFEHSICSELEPDALRLLLERANAPSENLNTVPVPFNLNGEPHLLLPGGRIVPGEFTIFSREPSVAGRRRERVIESVVRLPDLTYLLRRTTGLFGETTESSHQLELEQIGEWLLKGAKRSKAAMRDRLDGLRRYAESMHDADLLQELDRVARTLEQKG